MARVDIQFDGSARGALAAARQTSQGIEGVHKSAAGANRQLDDTQRSLGRFTRGAVAGSGALGSLGRAVAFASAGFLGGAGLVAALRTSVSAASNLEEQINKTKVVFAQAADGVLEWSKTTVESMGIARDQALEFAGTFGNLLRPMGLAPAVAAEMSKSLVKLASDMASFNNTSIEDALEAIRSGLVGETEPLRQFGVRLSEARIEAEAFTSGIAKTTRNLGDIEAAQTKVSIATAKLTEATAKYGPGTTQAAQATLALRSAEQALEKAMGGSHAQLTEQQKALARYQLILKDTKLQQGDYQRTIDSTANQQRQFSARIRETEAAVGKVLLPTVNRWLHSANEWLSKSENQEKVTNAVKRAVELLGTAVETAVSIIRPMIDVASKVADALGGWEQAIKLATAAWVFVKLAALAKAIGLLSGGGGGGRGPGGGLLDAANAADLLRGRLAVLARVAPIAIPVTLLVGFERKGREGRGLENLPGPLGDAVAWLDGLFGDSLPSAPGRPASTTIGGFGGFNPAAGLGPFKAPIQPTAYAPGQAAVGARVQTFGNALANAVGHDVPISGGAHTRNVKGKSTQSEHWIGNAGDFPATGAELLRLGRTALVLAGMPPAQANKVTSWPGGDYNGYNILFNVEGHYDHLHVGVGKAKSDIPPGLSSIFNTQRADPKSAATQPGAAVEALIRQGAIARGLDPDAVVAVVKGEGGFRSPAPIGDGGHAFGPFQLNNAGGVITGRFPGKNSAAAQAFANSPEGIAYALDEIAKVAKGKRGTEAISAIISQFERPADIPASIRNAIARYTGAGGDTPGGSSLSVGAKDTTSITHLETSLAERLATVEGKGTKNERSVLQEVLKVYQRRLVGAKGDDRVDLREAIRDTTDRIKEITKELNAAVQKTLDAAEDKARKQIKEQPGRAAIPTLVPGITARILAAQRATDAALRQATASRTEGTDVLGTLLGFDQSAVVRSEDKWGRAVETSIGTIAGKVKAALDALEEAQRSGNVKAINAAVQAWNDLSPAIAGAVGAGLDAAQRAVEQRQTRLQTALTRVGSRILSGFDRETSRGLQRIRSEVEAQIAGIERDLAAAVRGAEAAGRAPTAEESNLAAFRAAREAEARAQARAEALAIEDPAERARRLRELDLQDQERALEEAAQLSREARDANTQALIEGLQNDARARTDALQEEAARRAADYEDQRAAQRAALEEQLADWQTGLIDKTKSWAEFILWLQGQQAPGGLLEGVTEIPDPVAAMAAAGAAQGSAFAGAFAAEMRAALEAYNALITAVTGNPLSAASAGAVVPADVQIPGGFGGRAFALGGKVSGRYVGRDDTVMGRLTPGEYVIDRTLTRRLEQALAGGGGIGGGPTVVRLYLDGQEFAQAVVGDMDTALARLDLAGRYRAGRG